MRLELTGTAVVMAERAGQFLRDLTTSLISAAGLILVIIAVTFRSWRVALLSAIPNLFPLVVISGALVVSGLPMQLASVTIFTACLGLAVDDTLHVLHRYRLQPLSSPVEASLKRSVTGVGLAMMSSTLVLSAGFATLMLSDIPTSRTFGSLGCLGMLAALAGDLILLPAPAGVLPGGLPARSPRSRGR